MAYFICAGVPTPRLSPAHAYPASTRSTRHSTSRGGLTRRCIISTRSRKKGLGMRNTLRRRMWHLSSGLCIAMAAWFLPDTILLVSLGTITFLFLAFEILRLNIPRINDWFFSRFGSLLRDGERASVTTSSYVLIAALP